MSLPLKSNGRNKKGGPVNPPLKATCNSLRLYKEREAFAFLRIDCFSIPNYVSAEHSYHATFILRFIWHTVTLLSRQMHTRLYCLGALYDADIQRKSPRHGYWGLSLFSDENGQDGDIFAGMEVLLQINRITNIRLYRIWRLKG